MSEETKAGEEAKPEAKGSHLGLVNQNEGDKEFLKNEIKEGDQALNKLKVQHLDFILDIPIKVTVELGRAKVMVKELLQLGQGSVVELNKLAGDALEVMANGKMIAKGEVVVVNEKFGIRLTEIVSPIDRIETIK